MFQCKKLLAKSRYGFTIPWMSLNDVANSSNRQTMHCRRSYDTRHPVTEWNLSLPASPDHLQTNAYTFPNEDEDEVSCTYLPLSGPTYTFLHAEKDQTWCAYLSLRSSPHVSTHVHPSMKTTIQSVQTHIWDVLPHALSWRWWERVTPRTALC